MQQPTGPSESPVPGESSNAGGGEGNGLSTRAKGATAEDQAVEYLEKKGYAILARNFQIHIGEIDCIARDPDNTVVFVEVTILLRTNISEHIFSQS